MSSSLEDLFVQILQSEQKAQERKNILGEVKSQITRAQEQLNRVRNEKDMLKGQLVIKVQRWNDEEQELKWLSTREDICRQQVREFRETQEQLKCDLRKLEEKISKERGDFFDRVRNFCSSYDLLSWKTGYRTQRVREEIKKLKEEKEELAKEVQAVSKENEDIRALEEQKCQMERELSERESTMEELSSELQAVDCQITEAEAEKKRVSLIPQTGDEFIRLQTELEACRDDTLEGVCSALKVELEELRRGKWQREMQQKYHFKQQQQIQQQNRPLQPAPKQMATGTNKKQHTASSTGQSSNFQRFTNFARKSDANDSVSDVNVPVESSSKKGAQLTEAKKRPNLTKLTKAIANEVVPSSSTERNSNRSTQITSKKQRLS